MSGQRFPWGNTISLSLANFRNDGGESYQTGPSGYNPAYATGGEPYTSPVGSFAPNGYGLYDMAGNVSDTGKAVGVVVSGSIVILDENLSLDSEFVVVISVPDNTVFVLFLT